MAHAVVADVGMACTQVDAVYPCSSQSIEARARGYARLHACRHVCIILVLVMAYIVMAYSNGYGIYSYGSYSYGLCHGLYSYALYSYGLYRYGL